MFLRRDAPLKFHTKYLIHTLKDMILYNVEILRALRFKSSYSLLKRPPVWPKWHLIHWGWGKMDAISQTTSTNAFSWMKIYEFRVRFHWILFLMFKLAIFQPVIPALVQIMAWYRSGDKPLSAPMIISLPMHICVTWPQWDRPNPILISIFF